MANRDLTKTYLAEGAIEPNRILKFGSADYSVVQAAGPADKLIGVTGPILSVIAGERCDVIHEGIVELKLGGTVIRGDLITSDANACGVTAAPATGVNQRHIGTAVVSGVAGDLIPVLLNIGITQG